jgi:hypothetical protein
MDVYLPEANGENFLQIFSTDIQSVAGWFSREYEMHSIDLKIQSIINSHEIIRLILGSKEKNSGLTVVFRPKNASSTNGNNNNQAPQSSG